MSRAKKNIKDRMKALNVKVPYKGLDDEEFSFKKPVQVAPKPPKHTAPSIPVPSQLPTQVEAGYIKIKHAIFQDGQIRELTGESFKLYLWFASRAWRFPESNGLLRASGSYINTGTGIPPATIGRALKKLMKVKLIQLIETNHREGNLWQVDPRAVMREEEKSSIKRKEQVNQNDETVPSNRESSSVDSSQQFPQNDTEEKTLKNYKKFNSLSDPRIIQYVNSIQSPTKQSSERVLAKKLISSFSEEVVGDCLEWVLQNGEPSTAKHVHSPMAFLEKAIDTVKRECNKKRKAEIAKSTQIQNEAILQEEENEKHKMQAKNAEFCFKSEFKSDKEQENQIQRLLKKYSSLNLVPVHIQKTLAILKWYEGEYQCKAL